MKSNSSKKWPLIVIFFAFMMLHQADKLLIGPLTTPIMEFFQIDEAQMGLVTSGALLIGGVFYPLWGYLYDRFSRAKLLSLASFLWGATTWLSAIVKSYGAFVVTRASTGIDDASYPGLYSLVSDHFPPKTRGKIYGLLQVAQPVGYIIGMLLALTLVQAIHWQGVFYLTGTLGVILSLIIFFFAKDAPRGGAEPELAGVEQLTKYKFKWSIALSLFRKRSLQLLFIQGFFGSFPWQVITFWFFRYLETERNFSSSQVMITMIIAIIFLALGYPVGGAIGDALFKKNLRGRLMVSAFGVIAGAVLLWISMSIPDTNVVLFTISMSITAFFIPFASPNVLSTFYDVTLPEVRATANSIQNLIEQGGSAVAPALAGLIAVNTSLKSSILIICVGAWLLCFLFFMGAIYLIPRDIRDMHNQLIERAAIERQQQGGPSIESSHPEPVIEVPQV